MLIKICQMIMVSRTVHINFNYMANKAFNFVTLIKSQSKLNEWFSAQIALPPPHSYLLFSDCDSIW